MTQCQDPLQLSRQTRPGTNFVHQRKSLQFVGINEVTSPQFDDGPIGEIDTKGNWIKRVKQLVSLGWLQI